jgi:hypothetical protein
MSKSELALRLWGIAVESFGCTLNPGFWKIASLSYKTMFKEANHAIMHIYAMH